MGFSGFLFFFALLNGGNIRVFVMVLCFSGVVWFGGQIYTKIRIKRGN